MNDEHFELLRDDLRDVRAEIRAGFLAINGRVRDAEQAIAILKDRDGRKAMFWGSGAATASIGIVEAIRAYFK